MKRVFGFILLVMLLSPMIGFMIIKGGLIETLTALGIVAGVVGTTYLALSLIFSD